MNRKLTLVSLALALVLALAACAAPAAEAPNATEAPVETEAPATEAPVETEVPAEAGLTITDMTGREITLVKPAEKIVALTPSDCEILYAIGAGDTLIGRGEYCNYPEDCLALPSVSSGADTNLESILALTPDAVVMSTMAQTDEQVAALEKAGTAVVVSDAQTIDGVYTAIALLGTLTGHNDEAAALVTSLQEGFKALAAKVPAGDKKSVYFEVSPLEYGLWAAGDGTFMNEIAAMLNLQNVFLNVSGWGQVSEEQVVSLNPDYIVTTTMYFGEGPTPVEELTGRTGWQDVAAVKENHVFNADSDSITRPGPRLLDAANALCDFVYGG